MPAQAAARLAREKKVLTRKHSVMVDSMKDIMKTNRTEGSVWGSTPPAWNKE